MVSPNIPNIAFYRPQDKSGELRGVDDEQPSVAQPDVEAADVDADDVEGDEVGNETGNHVSVSDHEVSFHPQSRSFRNISVASDRAGRSNVDKPEAAPRHELIENTFAGSADLTGVSSIEAQVMMKYQGPAD